jgi:hypothetical protein
MHRLLGARHGIEDLFRAAVKQHAGVSEALLARGALEQARAKQFFQLAYPWRHRMASRCPIMLEETGLLYEAHGITLDTEGVLSPAFLSLNPNNKIPAILGLASPSLETCAIKQMKIVIDDRSI